MSTVNWLHLTDLHRGAADQLWRWPNIEEKFFSDLEQLHDRCGPWQILFFSGDLVNSGGKDQYSELSETLKRLYLKLEKWGSKPILLTVPGNHDLTRPSSSPQLNRLREWYHDPDVQAEFWQDGKSELRSFVNSCFRNYGSWLRNHPFPKPPFVKRGAIAGDFATTLEFGDIRLGVMGLNSTFLQLEKGDFDGKLTVSPRQVVSVCGANFTDWFAQHTCCMLMTHQPPSWLDEKSRAVFNGEVCVPGRFVGHFCGHLHESSIVSTAVGGELARRIWQGLSLFGLEHYGEEKEERRHGYSAGRITIAEKGSLRMWPRRGEKHQAGHWHLVPDNSATLLADDGTKPEEFDTRNVRRPTRGTRPYRVQLLSTERDLAPWRQTIAEFLRGSLGVTIMSSPDEGKPDLSVLVQAWCWEEGKMAALWQRTPAHRRTCFLIEEEADWPPRRLVEIAADSHIREFRAALSHPITFAKPEELSELVGTEVTKRMRDLSGDSTVGLTDWERKYLEFRLPAWRSGRTTLSRPHLFDVQDAKELYEPDLYVTLDGTSVSWRRGATGDPQPIRRRQKKEQKGSAQLVTSQRVSLARWLTVPALSRVALVGAPGGGKTIFLTRVAAAFAYACLGRNLDFEPELRVEQFRDKIGLPIPIVLEATRIAAHDPSELPRSPSEKLMSPQSFCWPLKQDDPIMFHGQKLPAVLPG